MRRKPKAVVFCGDLNVEEGDFTLRADRLILQSEELRFQLTGFLSEFGHFDVEGVAPAVGTGGFASSKIVVKFEGDRYTSGSVIFSPVHLSPKGLKCDVNGMWTWTQGEIWKFSGRLNRFSQPKL